MAELGDELVGLAHYRPFARPLAATVGGYLDDLYVAPEARGSGAADALLARLREIAADRGWSVVRWITADDNHRARAKYDQVATRTMWVTYDMPVEPRLTERAGAPGGARTHTESLLRRVPLPIGIRGQEPG